MAHRAPWLSIACLLALVGCSDRTGVILEVTRDPGTTDGVAIDKLRFYVGLPATDAPDRAGPMINGAEGEEVAVGDRDLADDPYKMLFTPKQVADMGLTVAVVGMSGGEPVAYGELPGEVHFIDGQVLSFPVMLYGAAGDVVIGPTGCLTIFGDGDKIVIAPTNDRDCDDDPADVDCNDNDPTVGPSSPEICFNQRDDDCDDMTDEQEDRDNDGVLNCDDCDDTDEHRYPGNAEVCDGIDNDCNEVCDDGDAFDGDGDKYTTCGTHIRDDGTCAGPNVDLVDCNDDAASVHPDADEICDGLDNDCNEVCDDDFDRDGDFYTECGSDVRVCNGTSPELVDCEPDSDKAFPGNRPERCDGLDNDCDGVYYPATVPCYARDNSGGEDTCKLGTRTCGDATGTDWTSDCVAQVNAEVVPIELCDAYDTCTDAADPYACANGMVTATTYQCSIAYTTAAAGSVCQPNGVSLPNTQDDAAVSCRWLLTSAGFRSAYEATLGPDLDVGMIPNKVFDACNALFAIIKPNVVPPVMESFLAIQLADGDKVQIVRLNVTPQAVSECPANGLTCTGLISPQPPAP